MREQGLLTLQYPSGLLRLSREDKHLPATHHISSCLTDLSNLSSQRPHSLYTAKAKLITLPRKPVLSSFLSWSPRFRCSFSLLATTYVLPKPAVLSTFKNGSTSILVPLPPASFRQRWPLQWTLSILAHLGSLPPDILLVSPSSIFKLLPEKAGRLLTSTNMELVTVRHSDPR